jgi:hypothetical protein
MTILDEMLAEEYERLERGILLLREEIEALPKGYISQKKIGNGVYYYLQNRNQTKIVSRHLKKEEVQTYRELIQKRKNLAQKVKELQAEQHKIRAALRTVKADE